DGDDCLSASDIALKQAVHRSRTGHIFDDFRKHALLCAGWFKRQHRANGFAHSIIDFNDGSLGRLLASLPAQTHREREPEEFIEDQSLMCRRRETVVQLERRVVSRKVYVAKRGCNPNEFFSSQHFCWKHVFDFRKVETL